MPPPAADAGYLTDLEYTGNFYPFLAPARLAYTAAINGYRAPSLAKFTWCELGCGKGTTALLLAALHPQGEFIGCDLNPAHIEEGERLRQAAGVNNLRLHAKSVAQMLHEDVPPCDFIVMHGLYGWVPAPVREEIHTFLRRFLKPGGLVFLSYNALPGWAHLQPLREMMRAFAAHVPGDTVQKVRGAFERLRFLAENDAAYFRELPAAAEHLKDMAARDLRYIAHEYLTPHGAPFYFADVARAMASASLAYAGSANPQDNYTELMAPPAFDRLLGAARSRHELETLRDFIVNARFRRDAFTAQPPAEVSRGPVLPAAFDGLAFALTGLPESLPLKRDDGALAFDLDAEREAVAAIHALLARGLPDIPLACPRLGSATASDTLHAAAMESCLCNTEPDGAARHLLARLRALDQPAHRRTTSGELEAVGDGDVAAYVNELWRTLRDPASAGARSLRLYGLQP